MGGNFAVLNPCAKKWADLEGKGRVRFCDCCQTYVHAVEQYSPIEWKQVEQEATGRVCILLCGETLAAPRSRRAVLIGALLTAVAPLWGQTGRVRIRVTDPSEAAVPMAQVSLLHADDKPTRTVAANDSGEVLWTDLPSGDAHFLVIVPGFNSRKLTVTIRNGDEQTVEARLELGFIGTRVEVEPVQIQPPQALVPPTAPASLVLGRSVRLFQMPTAESSRSFFSLAVTTIR
jgi:hypothetical protein